MNPQLLDNTEAEEMQGEERRAVQSSLNLWVAEFLHCHRFEKLDRNRQYF